MSNPDQSVLKVRRSVLVKADAAAVWSWFKSFDQMNAWWGVIAGRPDAGEGRGQYLDVYEPRVGGQVRLAVNLDGARRSFGGEIVVIEENRELTYSNDWIPPVGGPAPTFITLRLTPAKGGALVEMFHHGFERTDGGDALHLSYEQGWGMLQLETLKRLCEGA